MLSFWERSLQVFMAVEACDMRKALSDFRVGGRGATAGSRKEGALRGL